jgi:hypothetical protein
MSLTLFAAWRWYHWYDLPPWRAKVISVEGTRVCTVPDRGVKDPGWREPVCFDDGLYARDGRRLFVRPRMCVELQVYHPDFYAKRVVTCARS